MDLGPTTGVLLVRFATITAHAVRMLMKKTDSNLKFKNNLGFEARHLLQSDHDSIWARASSCAVVITSVSSIRFLRMLLDPIRKGTFHQ
jgi:hypothetical protein